MVGVHGPFLRAAVNVVIVLSDLLGHALHLLYTGLSSLSMESASLGMGRRAFLNVDWRLHRSQFWVKIQKSASSVFLSPFFVHVGHTFIIAEFQVNFYYFLDPELVDSG